MLSLISTFNFFFIITSCQKLTYYGTYTKQLNFIYIKKTTRRGKNHKSCININRTKENLCIKLLKNCMYLSLNDVECYVNVHVIPWLTTYSLSHCPRV